MTTWVSTKGQAQCWLWHPTNQKYQLGFGVGAIYIHTTQLPSIHSPPPLNHRKTASHHSHQPPDSLPHRLQCIEHMVCRPGPRCSSQARRPGRRRCRCRNRPVRPVSGRLRRLRRLVSSGGTLQGLEDGWNMIEPRRQEMGRHDTCDPPKLLPL